MKYLIASLILSLQVLPSIASAEIGQTDIPREGERKVWFAKKGPLLVCDSPASHKSAMNSNFDLEQSLASGKCAAISMKFRWHALNSKINWLRIQGFLTDGKEFVGWVRRDTMTRHSFKRRPAIEHLSDEERAVIKERLAKQEAEREAARKAKKDAEMQKYCPLNPLHNYRGARFDNWQKNMRGTERELKRVLGDVLFLTIPAWIFLLIAVARRSKGWLLAWAIWFAMVSLLILSVNLDQDPPCFQYGFTIEEKNDD